MASVTKPGISEGVGNDAVEQGRLSNEDLSKDPGSAVENTVTGRPPPLDVSEAQQLQHHQSMSNPRTPTSGIPLGLQDKRKDKERKIGHRRVDEEGQITYKKIQTTQIMGSIQLGISYAVGSLASKPERDLLMQDFTIVETTFFSGDGSNITPAHHYSDFRFKAYAPVAFRYFRDLFGIQPDDFLLSLCNEPMRELTNPGASGSIFYLTNDDEFIIKTVQHKEAEFLQKLLPGYYMNLNQNPRTLLPKFFGLYCYQCGGKNIRLVVMNNLLPSYIKMHQKYDLKGSTYKRKAGKYEKSKQSPTYKDLDFMEHHTDGIYLEVETYNALMKTIQRDCRVLESFKIMDYSLLVGIHNIDLSRKERMEAVIKAEEVDGKPSLPVGRTSLTDAGGGETVNAGGTRSEANLTRSKSINRQRLAAFSTALESIQATVETIEDEDVPPGGIPARNSKGDRLVLYLGIIDILQSFRLKKKLEHTWKSVLHDGDTVSVHRPSFYAQRFQDFMAKTVFKKIPSSLKHSPSKRKGISLRPRPPSSGESDLPRPGFLIKSHSDTDNLQYCPDSAAPTIVPCPPSPPTVDSNLESVETKKTWSGSERLQEQQQSRANTEPVPIRISSFHSSVGVNKASSVTWDKTEVISLSQVTFQTESIGSMISEASSSSTSGLGSTLPTVTWTPPHSIEGSTPTHTEGTPSFTESSSSGDVACPTTPVKTLSQPFETLPPVGETQIFQETEMTRL